MKMFKSKIQKIRDKIAPNNLHLLNDDELESEYYCQKLLDWQENEYFYCEDWKEFKEHWHNCDRCKSYQEGQCICYAR